MPRAKNLEKAQQRTSGLKNRRPAINKRKKGRVSSDESDVSEDASSSDEENNTIACIGKRYVFGKVD